MLLRHFFTPGLCVNSYLVFDEETRLGAVIDPTRQTEMYLNRAMQDGIQITDILETHVHADFISGAVELKTALGGKVTIHCSGLGGEEWIPSYADHIVADREAIRLGSVRLEAWHTPGHTPEHLIWVAYDEHRSQTFPLLAFTGDLLFVGSVGRPDLLGDETKTLLAKKLYRSLFSTIYALPDSLEIYPTHGAGSLCGKEIGKKLSSTLGYEKKCNPWLIPQDYPRWENSLQLDSLPIPDYFKRMKARNLQGLNGSKKQAMPSLLTPEQVKKLPTSILPVDFRRPDDFALGSLKGAINIPIAPSLPLWAGTALPADKELLLIVDCPEAIFPVVQSLNLVGLDHLYGVVDLSRWTAAEKKDLFVSSPSISVEALKAEKEKFYILDVRTQHEWDLGHIEQANHLDLIRAIRNLNEIPLQKPIAVICHSGNRASIVASLLVRERNAKAFNVKGGMQAWSQIKNLQGFAASSPA